MQELKVSCGCGRTMTIDALRGRGAFRCGCGARIRAEVSKPPANRRRCWWTGCNTVAVSPAPIDFCEEHLKLTVKHVANPAGFRALWERSVDKYLEENPPEQYPQPPEKPTQVYFMRRELLIKIGYSVNPLKRAQSLGAIVLAQIPGNVDVERNHHRRFKHLRQHGEWFSPGEDLITYINKIRRANRQQPITASPDRHFLETVLLDGTRPGRT